MDDGNMNQPAGHSRFTINQNLLIAIIGAAATIMAALIPYFLNANKSPQPVESTPIPTLVSLPTDTAVPLSTSTGAASPTDTLTPVPQLPTETPTTPVGIYDVYLAQDKAGQYKSSVFGPQQTVYIFFSLNDPSGQNDVEVRWYAVEAKGFPSNTVIRSEEETVVRQKDSFEMLFAPSWRVGRYKVELYLNGSLAETQEFEIK